MALSYDSGLSWQAAKALFESATYNFTNDDCVLLADWYTYREIADRRVEQGLKSGDPYNAVLNGVKVKAKALCKSQSLDFEKWKEAFDIRRKRNIQDREGGTKNLPDAASGSLGTFATKSSTKTTLTSNAAPQSSPAVHRHNALATPFVPAAESSAQDAQSATGLHPQLSSQYLNVPPWSRSSNSSTTQFAGDVYIGTPYVQHHQNPPKPLGWPKRPVSGVDTSVSRANFPVAGPALDPYPTVVHSYSARHGYYIERPLTEFPRTESGLYMVGDEDSYNAIYATPGARREPATVPPSQTASASAKQAQNFVDLTLSDEEEHGSTMQTTMPRPPKPQPYKSRQTNTFAASSSQHKRPVLGPNIRETAMAAPQTEGPIHISHPPYAAFAPYPQPGILYPGAVPYPNLAPNAVPPSSSTSRQTPASTEQQQSGAMMRPPPIPSPHRSNSNASRLESAPNSTATSTGTRNAPPARTSNTQALPATQPNQQTQQTQTTPISRKTRATAAALADQNTVSSWHVAGTSGRPGAPTAPHIPRDQPSRDGLVGIAALLHKASGAKPTAVTRQQKNGLTAQLVNLVRLLGRDFEQFELSFVRSAVVGLGREGGDTDETKSKFDEQSEDAGVWPQFKSATTKDQAEFVRWAVDHWLEASGIYNTTFLTFMSDCFEQYESLKHEMEEENDSSKAERLPAKQ
ncbi:hypothetical protein TI39_contig961g00004 [Zymoseptoria brevis]|uniref:Uncharacterized protein n=1 Tax=Zymoseptoria brevis TaxID=1047168 RepID=A0A0F4GEK1_9PEZI|nr:hypothetical protein TI39_contig961g00004 [Zymoseptoria brevis]